MSMQEEDKMADKKDYEIGFVVAAEENVDQISKLLGQHGVEIKSTGQLKKVSLAYKIKKVKEAFFGFCLVSALPADIKNLEKDLMTSPEILRFLIVSLPKTKAAGVSPGDDHVIVKKPYQPQRSAPAVSRQTQVLSNEALEKKIEEILQ